MTKREKVENIIVKNKRKKKRGRKIKRESVHHRDVINE
jgi:hypothetical protein